MDLALQALLEAETAGNNEEEDEEEENEKEEDEASEWESEGGGDVRSELSESCHTSGVKRKHTDMNSDCQRRLRAVAHPPNFSQVDPALDPALLQSRFPLFTQ